jgi:hypothetical protein
MSKERVYDFLRGKFLLSEEASKHWWFIIFCTLLALIMIASSHSAERKVHLIAKMNNEVRELRSESIAAKKNLMTLKMKSTLEEKLKNTGVGPAKNPPKKIIVYLND